jgi:hypothetical protein
MMSDETRKILKLFGVAVTDFEAEAERLAAVAAQLGTGSSRDEVARLLQDAAELCREVNARWFEATRHVHLVQEQLLAACAEAAKRTAKQ